MHVGLSACLVFCVAGGEAWVPYAEPTVVLWAKACSLLVTRSQGNSHGCKRHRGSRSVWHDWGGPNTPP